MSNVTVTKVENLGYDLAAVLSEYSGEVRENVKKAIRETADELVTQLKETSPDGGTQHKHKYKKSWVAETTFESETELRMRVKSKDAYQLTHLLEYGHKLKTVKGKVIGFVQARPHIKRGDQAAQEKLIARIEEAAQAK